jgi:hypothetical protein
MPRGGARPGAGRPKGGRKQPAASAPIDGAPQLSRPRFDGPKDFGVWALNAPDAEVSMDQKLRAMQVLATLAGKQAEPKEDKPAAPVPSKYAPREVKGFRVVAGGGK